MIALGFALVLAALAPMLMGPTSGYPSRPIVRTLNAISPYGGGTGTDSAIVARSIYPMIELRETDAAANNVRWRMGANTEQFFFDAITDDGSTGANFVSVDRTGTTVDSIALAATTVTINGFSVTPEQGPAGVTNLTLTTGCSTTPTVEYRWSKVGPLVSLQVNGVSCTSNVTSDTIIGALPANLRPTTVGAFTVCRGTNNAVEEWQECNVDTAGNITIKRLGLVAYTATGTRGTGGFTLMYSTNWQ